MDRTREYMDEAGIPRFTPGGCLLGIGALLVANLLIFGVYVFVRQTLDLF